MAKTTRGSQLCLVIYFGKQQLLQLSCIKNFLFLPSWKVVVNGTVLTKLRLNKNLKYPTTKLLECTSLKPFINMYIAQNI